MLAGDVVAGRYRIVERLGAGSMGEVWRAADLELGRDVALKRALDSSGADAERLRREARAAAGVHHPGVVMLFDVVEQGGERWLVMEYVAARSLAEVITERGPLPEDEVAALGAALAAALAAVHAAGVVHRDIKPANVLVRPDGLAKLGDFGISRGSWSEETLTSSAMVIGTPAYLAPEVAAGDAPTPASDVFALGATLLTALTGVAPYGGADNPLATLRRAAAGQPIPVPPGPLGSVLARLLAVDAAQRPDAAAAGALLTGAAAAETTLVGLPPALPPRSRRRPAIIVALVLLLGGAGAGVIAALAGGGSDPQVPAPLVGEQSTRTPAASPKARPGKTTAPAATGRPSKTKRAGTTSTKPSASKKPKTDAERAAEGARCAQLANTDPIAAAQCAEDLGYRPTPRPR